MASKNVKYSKSLRIHLVPKLSDRRADCWQGGSLQSVITDRWYQEAGKSRNASNKTALRTIRIPEWTGDLCSSATRSQGRRDQWPRLWSGQEQNWGSGSCISHKLLLTTITTARHPSNEALRTAGGSPGGHPGLPHSQPRLKSSGNSPDQEQRSFSSAVRECTHIPRSLFHLWPGTSSWHLAGSPPLHSSFRDASDCSNFVGNHIILLTLLPLDVTKDPKIVFNSCHQARSPLILVLLVLRWESQQSWRILSFLWNGTSQKWDHSQVSALYSTVKGINSLPELCPRHHGAGNPALSIGFHIPSCSLFLFPRQTKPAPTIGLNFPLFPLSVLCLAAQSCPTLCSPMDCTPPSSSAHGAVQARILEWITLPSSRVSSVYSSPIYPQRHPDQLKTAPQSHT